MTNRIPTTGLRDLRPGTPGGPLAVLAHGLEDSWDCWVPLARRFGPDWRVVALDLPWRAGNDYRWRGDGASADHLGAALDRVGGPVDVIVAHSFGANATLELLARGDRPTFRAAVLLCPLYCPPEQAVTWSVFDRARRTFDRHVRDGMRLRMGSRAESMDTDIFESMLAKAIDRIGPSGFLTVFEQFIRSGRLRLGDIGTPVLVLAGGADPTLSPDAARKLGRDMHHATLLVHDHYDHFCHVRHPGEVAGQTMGFVDAVRGAPALTTGAAE